MNLLQYLLLIYLRPVRRILFFRKGPLRRPGPGFARPWPREIKFISAKYFYYKSKVKL